MISSLLEAAAPADTKKVLIAPTSGRVPASVDLLNQWQYMERAVHRLLAAWGRQMKDFQDKAALHRHVWDQAEIVRRLRERIRQFPGGKPDAGVSARFAPLAEAALRAPSFEDALDGIYKILLRALIKAYVDHVQNTNPIHDAPTSALLHEINTIKEQHFFWYREYRRKHPHTTDRSYEQKLGEMLAALGGLRAPVVKEELTTIPCPADPAFFLPKVSFRQAGWAPKYNIMPFYSADFEESIECRRLFWGHAYLQEMNLPDDQLAWLYYGDYMPWEWHHDISRHLWDESRHGCSGYSRLQDWGIELSDVGFMPGNAGHLLRTPPAETLAGQMIQPFAEEAEADFGVAMTPMSQKDIYETVFFTGMVAESGHFQVKNESYDDFRESTDLASAEMMLFDIIDETAHVQYAHNWLPQLAEKAGVDNSNYRQRAVEERRKMQVDEDKRIVEARALPREASFGPWTHYQNLLERVRKACPLPAEAGVERRTRKPM